MKGKATGLVFLTNGGDKLTLKILTEDTTHLIFRSAVTSANKTTPNLCHELPSGESNPPNSNPTSHEASPDIPDQNFLWSQSECEDNSSLNSHPTPMATFTVDDLIGRSFLFPSVKTLKIKQEQQLSRKLRTLTRTQPTGENTSNFSSSSTTKR